MSAAEGGRSEADALELLLCYAIPQRDVRPLAEELLHRFGNLDGVLAAPLSALVAVPGVKRYVGSLLKLGHYLRTLAPNLLAKGGQTQIPLFEESQSIEMAKTGGQGTPETPKPRRPPARKREGPFAKAVFREAVDVLPLLPGGLVGLPLRQAVEAHLHFSAASTRERYAQYIIRRMLPAASTDDPIVAFARLYPRTQALRDACLYRFCISEPLMAEIAANVLIPSVGQGRLNRSRLTEYLGGRFPNSGALEEAVKAVVDVLLHSGLATGDGKTLYVSYRPIALPSFAFVLHSEFPEPGMYSIEGLNAKDAFRTQLWDPDTLPTALYELRNVGILAKVSQIDSVRQFTTTLDLPSLVQRLASTELRG